MTSSPTLALENDYLAVQLLPESGGRIARLVVRRHALEILNPIDSEFPFDPMNWPKGGAYPLIPYSNRIADACLNFDGQVYRLPPHPQALPHTLHGISHTQAWNIDERLACQASISLDYSGPHWPWPFRAEQHFALEGNVLSIDLLLRNKGSSAMPGGLGLHPYFQVHPDFKIRFGNRCQWKIADDYLATGEYSVGTFSKDLTPLDWHAKGYAEYLSQWGGEVDLDYLQGSLKLRAGPELDHLVVFAPAESSYVCVEPVSHLADGFNLMPQLPGLTGTRTIEPGDQLTARVSFAWRDRSDP